MVKAAIAVNVPITNAVLPGLVRANWPNWLIVLIAALSAPSFVVILSFSSSNFLSKYCTGAVFCRSPPNPSMARLTVPATALVASTAFPITVRPPPPCAACFSWACWKICCIWSAVRVVSNKGRSSRTMPSTMRRWSPVRSWHILSINRVLCCFWANSKICMIYLEPFVLDSETGSCCTRFNKFITLTVVAGSACTNSWNAIPRIW